METGGQRRLPALTNVDIFVYLCYIISGFYFIKERIGEKR